jgi:hypothetical protein
VQRPIYTGISTRELRSGTIEEGKFDFDVNEAPQMSATDIRDAESVMDAREEPLHIR